MFAGMSLLGDLGDRLGPGYRDLLQGVAGMALLGLGPKMAKGIKPPQFKPGFSEADILAIPKGSRPDPSEYLTPQFMSKHLAQFDKGASRLMSKGNLDKYGIGQKDAPRLSPPGTKSTSCWPAPRAIPGRWKTPWACRRTFSNPVASWCVSTCRSPGT